ncbi:MAG TPA: molecular chaperone TorD family protein [Acidimicrobiales bacterium]|nr:molecular chaperone TorD family protein [Acidimicrobiales bacterium]
MSAPAVTRRQAPAAGRSELLRALGALCERPSPEHRRIAASLGLPLPSGEEHTATFVLECPPYASVYLGPDGMLGGEATDRVAGFWRALGCEPPTEPDHLASILALLAALGELEAGEAPGSSRRARIARAREVLLVEHLWSWVPVFLVAVREAGSPPYRRWARLVGAALAMPAGGASARRARASAHLPLALRAAPAVAEEGVDDVARLATVAIRSGMVLTRRRLASGAGRLGLAARVGERRFALEALLAADRRATLAWLAREAGRWERLHRAAPQPHAGIRAFWQGRARATAALLARLAP